jgi:hypothetical protein
MEILNERYKPDTVHRVTPFLNPSSTLIYVDGVGSYTETGAKKTKISPIEVPVKKYIDIMKKLASHIFTATCNPYINHQNY